MAKQVLSKEKNRYFEPYRELVTDLEDDEQQLLKQLLADAEYGYKCYQMSLETCSWAP